MVWRWTLLLGMGSSKEERGRTRFLSKGEVGRGGETACTHAKLPLDPSVLLHIPLPQLLPPPPLFLALATRSASQRLLCINKYCSYPPSPSHSTISWTTLLHLHLIIPTPHTCAVTAAPIKGSLVRSVYSTVLFTIHICAPCSHMMGPASGPFCPLLYCT